MTFFIRYSRLLFSNPSWNPVIFHRYRFSSYLPGEETRTRDVLYKRLELDIKGHEPAVLRSYEKFVAAVCAEFELSMSTETINRPIFERLALNKSPFIFKKAKRHYEFRTYSKKMTIPNITGCTADVMLEYVQRNIPEGVAMTVTRHRIEPIGEHLSEIIEK